ncbi:c-type cytochrome [Deinococcus misasensis]|uniref:c-type cytochrome n=1 Tax=Deinococcus misasensis TaxID=392413 RepID=UPI0006902C9C|nr:c-type cytochrome [Deinococcus misasensis]
MKKMVLFGVLALGAAGTWVYAQSSSNSSAPTFTEKQAEAGEAAYNASCAGCHGKALDDGRSPVLKGNAFLAKWSGEGKTAADLYNKIATTMPRNKPGSLTQNQYEAIYAYLLQQNGFKPRELQKEDLKNHSLDKK